MAGQRWVPRKNLTELLPEQLPCIGGYGAVSDVFLPLNAGARTARCIFRAQYQFGYAFSWFFEYAHTKLNHDFRSMGGVCIDFSSCELGMFLASLRQFVDQILIKNRWC